MKYSYFRNFLLSIAINIYMSLQTLSHMKKWVNMYYYSIAVNNIYSFFPTPENDIILLLQLNNRKLVFDKYKCIPVQFLPSSSRVNPSVQLHK